MPLTNRAKSPAPKAEPPFTPDGQRLSDGSIRYKILCDGGIDPSGVFWTKTVPPGADNATLRLVQAERDAKVKELLELLKPAAKA